MTAAPHTITWEEVCADKSLQDLPFKVELNGLNQLVLVPTFSQHSLFQGRIIRWLNRLLETGNAYPELAIATSDNIKVPDVVWASDEMVRAHRSELNSYWSASPELCIEVLSPTNTVDEMTAKIALYFESGAREVWICGLKGEMEFHAPTGPLERSALCPEFPARIEV